MMATELEEETDESLIALTTHFAQVQFRLKQIISAEPQHKEGLLKELEEFAFQGCNKPMTYDTAAAGENGSTEAQRRRRSEMMEKLRNQLEEIEQCAEKAATVPESEGEGESGTVVSSMAEKQKIIIEELRKRFDFQFGDLERLSTEEVKHTVEKAVQEVVDPIRSKDEYVTQLQNQIKDLERYITFIQTARPKMSHDPHQESHDTNPHHQLPSPLALTNSKPKKVTFADDLDGNLEPDKVPLPSPLSRTKLVGPLVDKKRQPVPDYRLSMTQLDGVDCLMDNTMKEWEKVDSLGDPLLYDAVQGPDDLRLSLLVMRKTLAVMQVLTLCQCGGSFQCLPKYVTDGRRKRYHAALHSLEQAVDKIAIMTTALNEPGISLDTKVSLETDLHETVSMSLADSLRVLLEHGLIDGGKPVSFTGGCFPAWRNWGSGRGLKLKDRETAGWRVFKHYYDIKKGKEYSTKPTQMLSSAFSIPMDSSTSIKKTLLSSINQVDNRFSSSHHRASDTKFRALICEGFNVCHLAEWFRALATNPTVADDLYSVTSFLATTGFRPAIACLERLKDNPPCSPVELPQDYYQMTEAFREK